MGSAASRSVMRCSVTVQMALARGAKVIASASEANHDYLREIGATPVLYG
jgi:NADPH:quinone reductase-like Zn-dependent oxidoreductase